MTAAASQAKIFRSPAFVMYAVGKAKRRDAEDTENRSTSANEEVAIWNAVVCHCFSRGYKRIVKQC